MLRKTKLHFKASDHLYQVEIVGKIFREVDLIRRDVPTKSCVKIRIYSDSRERALIQSRERSKPVIGGPDRLVNLVAYFGLVLGIFDGYETHLYLGVTF